MKEREIGFEGVLKFTAGSTREAGGSIKPRVKA